MPESYGRYQLLKKLATGGMAQVYLAKQTGIEGFEKIVVLKKILPQFSEDDEFIEMFKHEARLAARLNHPNVAAVLDFGRQAEDGTYFYAMEFVHGEDIRRVVKQARAMGRDLPLPLILRIVSGACEGLQYAHDKTDDSGQPLGIVHRDISPQNVLVTFDGGSKIIDFGIAKAAGSVQSTRAGVIKGKYSYMSPEQARGDPLDRRSDVFALGIVLWELVTNTRLFKRDSDTETLNAVIGGVFDKPSLKNASIPPELDAIVMRALAQDREQRTPDCRTMQLELEDFIVQQRLAATSAHLAAFMREIYAERLKKEQEMGRPLYEEFASSFDSFSEQKSRDAHHAGQAAKLMGAAAGMAISSGPATVTDSGQMPTEPLAVGLSEPAPKKHTALLVASALGGAAAVAVVAWLALSQSGPPAIAPLVTSEPNGAELWLDGQKLDAVTPHMLKNVTAERTYRLRASKEAYEPAEREFRFQAGGKPDVYRINLVLAKKEIFGVLSVSSRPPGVVVMVEGKVRGMTPCVVPDVPAGRPLHVSLVVPGQPPRELEVTLEEGKVTQIAEDMSGAIAPAARSARPVSPADRDRGVPPPAPAAANAFLTVETTPPTEVFLDGKSLGLTPIGRREIKPGRYALLLKAGMLKQETMVDLTAGEEKAVQQKFVRRRVQFLVKPWAEVYIGKEKVCTTPAPPVDLYAGDYEITYVNPDLPARRTATVRVPESGDDPFRVNVSLSKGEGAEAQGP